VAGFTSVLTIGNKKKYIFFFITDRWRLFFFIHTYKSATKLGQAVLLKFQITQHNRDEQLLKSWISYFGCGYYSVRTNKLAGDLVVTKLSDIEKIIHIFNKYPIIGAKAKDFENFKRAAELMKNGAHLTPEGLEEIRLIKMGMNRGRN